MADYNGTDEDDIIDASELDSDIGNIRPGEGNDTITNATGKHTIVSSPGAVSYTHLTLPTIYSV